MRRVAWGIVTLVGASAIVALSATALAERGEAALADSDTALAAGDVATAVARARDAALSKVPWSGCSEGGYERLLAIADKAETRGAFEDATTALRAVLVSARATNDEGAQAARIKKAEEGLVRVSGKTCERDQTRDKGACEAAARKALGL